MCPACLRLVEDSEGLRLRRRGLLGVTAGVVNSVLVITQEVDERPGLTLDERGDMENTAVNQKVETTI